MTTDIELRPTVATLPAIRSDGAMKLVDWLEEARAANALAKSLVQTSFVPKHYSGKEAEATAAILAGSEIGLSPIASLAAIYNVGGKNGMYAETMLAVVQSHGHHVDVLETDDQHATVEGRRAGSDKTVEITWTIEDATKAGYVAKNPNYKTNPRSMLRARAIADACRLIAADALKGIAYTIEELDGQPEMRPQITARPKVTRADIEAQPQPAEPVDMWTDDGVLIPEAGA